MPQATNRRQPGYNIIELMVTVAILGLLAGITIPSLHFFKRQTIINELNRLQIACTFLQKKAIYTGRKTQLVFDINAHSYIYDQQEHQLGENVRFGFIAGASGPPAEPRGPINSPISFPRQKITFYPNGTISAGTAYLTDINYTNLYAITVPVAQVSFIRKYHYQNGQWIYLKV